MCLWYCKNKENMFTLLFELKQKDDSTSDLHAVLRVHILP